MSRKSESTFETAVKDLYPKSYNLKVRRWLKERYGIHKARKIWNKTKENYLHYLEDLPDMGGRKNGHAAAIYGGLLIFALYPALPDQPPIADLQDFVQNLFMEPFTKLGKLFNLNRGFDMWLIDKVFQFSGRRDRRDAEQYPDGFITVSEAYDKKHHAARYHFTQCPNAEFAKKHDLLHVLPLMCNSDFFGISQIHGQLIRCGTCGNSQLCDYLVVGSDNPIAREYETITDEGGFLVSRPKADNVDGLHS
ncbi:MAG: L-2-amino-thiazoline-4-carboxylic acid hydrolase [Eubacterium sp.]|nr:L-2-amino-thiazoline-4-carboxylic acid hydrolase [Eubacterium sp.]